MLGLSVAVGARFMFGWQSGDAGLVVAVMHLAGTTNCYSALTILTDCPGECV